jgi:hypothetical protein
MAQTIGQRLRQLANSDVDTASLDLLEDVTATATEINKLSSSGAAVPSGTVQSSIADLSVTGTYATDDTPIETAVNAIIAVLLEFGMIEAAE